MKRWRSVLFVPASRPELAPKALRSCPDAVVLDLEDAVPADQKSSARTALCDMVSVLVDHADVLVRVNPPATEWFGDDIAALPPA